MIWDKIYHQYKKFSVKFRARYFEPVLKTLAAWKITPNQITLFRLFFLVPLAYCFYSGNIWGAALTYILFWFLDLFDGALARYLKLASDQGRFWDTLTDNFMYGLLIGGMIYWQAAWPWLLTSNIFLEYGLQALAIIYRQGGKPSDFIIKAQADLPWFKAISHLGLILYLFGFNYLNFIFYWLVLIQILATIYFLIKLYNKLKR